LIAQGEHQQLDFKFEISDSKKIARTLTAFANTDGGTLLIGVKDNGHIAGVRSEEEYYMIEAASEMYCQPKIPIEAKEWNLEGKIVLEVKVKSSPDKPHKSPDKNNELKAYIRMDDENILVPEILELAWTKMSGVQGTHITISKPVEKLLNYLDTHPYITVNQFKKIARVNDKIAKNILSDLLAIGSLGYKLVDKKIVYGQSPARTDLPRPIPPTPPHPAKEDKWFIRVAPIRESSEELLARLENKDWYIPTLQEMAENRKREWLSVRVLLKEIIGMEKQILYTDSGKPYLADQSFHISISHTKGYVAVILDKEKPVAIDIEQISPRVEKIRTRFMDETEENNLSSKNRIIHLLLHWSAKESLFKILDENDIEFKMQLHINPFEPAINKWAEFTAHETRTGAGHPFLVHYFVDKDYVLTYLR
jgi:4'-phosphopantetheinyl transferase EntD